MKPLNFQETISTFCKTANIKKRDFALIMGLSSYHRIYELKESQRYHVYHFDWLIREQAITQKTGKTFVEHVVSFHKKD